MKPRCPACELELPAGVVGTDRETECPFCYRRMIAMLYPAALRVEEPAVSSPALSGEATCYFHSRKAAAAACAHCGRFVCGLCQTDFGGQSWCPDCLASGASKSKISLLESQRTLYDSVALGLATWPFLLGVWPSVLGVPAAIFVALRFWRRPTSIVRRWKWRFGLAIALGLAEIVLLAVLAYSVITRPVPAS